MANYVHNRVICNEQAKKQLENKNWCIDEHQKRYFIKYPIGLHIKLTDNIKTTIKRFISTIP